MTAEQHVENYFKSIIEREEIFIRKELLHLPKEQWTNVPVYRNYRFCNVHRCYDKTFKLISELSNKLGGIHPGLRTMLRWTACNPLIQWLIDNYTYNTEVGSALIHANKGEPEQLIAMILDAYHNGIIPLVTGSFIVKRYGNDYEEMLAYYKAGDLFHDIIICKYSIDDAKTTTQKAVQFFKDLAPWCADFGAYCIVSDWIYILPDMFTDLKTWTAYGPGAYIGICLLAGRDITKRNYVYYLQILREEWEKRAPEMFDKILVDTGLSRDQLNALCRQNGYYELERLLLDPTMLDVEHWLCEYAKYARGWAKKKYN